MATKTKSTTPAPAPKTAEELAKEALAMVERNIEMQANLARKALAEQTAKMVEAMNRVNADLALGTTDGDHGAAYNMLQSYWPLRDAAEAAGKLRTFSEIGARLAKLKAADKSPAEILRSLRLFVIDASLGDTSRSESSSNPFSNAMQQFAGDGRGRSYRDAYDCISCYLENLS